MTKVEIADVISQGDQFLVWLLDRDGKRRLPVVIGEAEGSALKYLRRGISFPRPLGAQLTANILDALEAELVEVRVEKLEQDVYYAVAVVRSGETVTELDARPSDAMCVAAVKGTPLFVTDAVWEKGGRKCSLEEIAQMGQSLRAGRFGRGRCAEVPESGGGIALYGRGAALCRDARRCRWMRGDKDHGTRRR